MKKTLTKNLGLKVLAVAFSILLWVIVMNNERPITSKTYVGVPVTLLHTELITNQGNTYQVAEETKLDKGKCYCSRKKGCAERNQSK